MKELAHKYHQGQFRKGPEGLPYIVHPRAVAEKLVSWGAKADPCIISIAWGHDLLEDTKVTENEILAVSNRQVLDAIKLLTRPEGMKKSLYLQKVACEGSCDVLLVKMADRICNTCDFVKLEGELYAFQYLCEAAAIREALEKHADSPVAAAALNEYDRLAAALKDEARRDAVRGSLLAGAAGDALGAPVEFLYREEILKKYGAAGVRDYVEFSDGTGAVTDDTQMLLFTAEGLLRAKTEGTEMGECALRDAVYLAYQRWLMTQGVCPRKSAPDSLMTGELITRKELFKRRAPGITCISALESGEKKARNNSKGCGTVMRMAPVGLFLDPAEAWQYGCEFSEITHGHPTGITAGGALAMLIALLLEGKTLEHALDLTEKHLEKISDAAETLAALRKARRAEDISELGEGWVAEEALAIAVYCALKHTWNLQEGILEAVNITGDSDSTGAIAGNILGVLNGEKAIPESWLKNLREYEIVSSMADDLTTQRV